MNNSRSHFDAILDRRNMSGGERLASLNRSIESIERKLNEISNTATSQIPDAHQGAPSVTAKVEDIERRLRALNSGPTVTARPAPQPNPGDKHQFSSNNTRPLPEFAMAEIAERKRSLNNASVSQGHDNMVPGNNAGYVAPYSAPTPDISSELHALNEKIDNLQTALSSEINGVHEFVAQTSQAASPTDELARIAEGIRELQQAPRFDSSAFDALHNDLDELRHSLGSTPQREEIGNGFTEVNMRLDKISDDMPEYSSQTLAEIRNSLGTVVNNTSPQRSEMVAERLDSLGQAVGTLSQSMELSNLDQRLQTLIESVEQLSSNPNVTSASQPDLTLIENRLDEITRAIVAVSVNERTALSADSDAIDRLEQQLANLARGVELLAQRDGEQHLADLAARIDNLTGQLEILDNNIQNNPTQQQAAATDSSLLEGRLQELANRIDSALKPGTSDDQLKSLEVQIAGIAKKLSDDDADASTDFSELESRLGQIEQTLSENRDQTLEAISQAARSAIDKMENDGLSGELIAALSQDLKALRNAANQTENSSAETLQIVQNTLSGVANRLEAIESRLKPEILANSNSGTLAKAAFVGTKPQSSVLEAGLLAPKTAIASELLRDAPSIDPSADLPPLPLNPASSINPSQSEPDEFRIASPAKRAARKTDQPVSKSDPYLDKTDFVAVARRAAQLAAADVQAVKLDEARNAGNTKKPSMTAGIPRRPIIIAAAAILMAVFAFTGSRMYFSNSDNKSAAVVEMPSESDTEKNIAEVAGPEELSPEAQIPEVRKAVPSMTPDENIKAAGEIVPEVSPPQGFDADAEPIPSNSFIANTNPGQENTGISSPGSSSQSGETMAVVPAEQGTNNKITAEGNNTARTDIPGPASLRDAAAKGDVRAEYEIGLRYTNGDGVNRDLKEAAKWYERAAAQEFAPAQYRLGSLYEKGLGVERDLPTASSWYQRAADQGNARAMHNLAVISAMGASGQPNMELALNWFQRAANLGVKDSQFNLGILFGQGMGVSQNLGDSYKWFAIAAKTGDTDAAKKRDEVANVMDTKALEAARLIVRNWKPQKLIDSANRVVIPEQWRKSSASSAALDGKSAIYQVQTALNKLGFDVGPPDGISGPKTRRAIIGFQKKAGLPVSGKIDAQLVKALKGLSI